MSKHRDTECHEGEVQCPESVMARIEEIREDINNGHDHIRSIFKMRGDRWHIDCGSLSYDDMETLAHIALEKLPPFREATSSTCITRSLADILNDHATSGPMLIVQDVYYEGSGHMELMKKEFKDAIGLVIFARDEPPDWVEAIFTVNMR